MQRSSSKKGQIIKVTLRWPYKPLTGEQNETIKYTSASPDTTV